MGDATASDLRIPMEAPEGTELELRVDDGSDAALTVTAVRAELAPQPWIYFETQGGPVTALCGNPALGRPRYDLEALRDQLTPARAAQAHWGPEPAAAVPAPGVAAGLDPGPGSVLDAGAFPFRRPVPPGPRGLTALVLDPHVLAHSPGLGGLRLLDRDRRQVPYLLERRDQPLALDLALVKGQGPVRTSRYALALPQAGLPEARLVLETGARVFSRQVLVREPVPGGEAVVLAASAWTHQDPETPAPPLALPLPLLRGALLLLDVAEGDNQPLPLQRARLLLPGWRLRFFQPEGPLELCYGQELAPPQYDLALLAGRLRDAPAREVTLDGAGAEPGPDRTRTVTRVFWAVLALAVAGLLVLLARLLKAPPD
jgi:hypothetical protein